MRRVEGRGVSGCRDFSSDLSSLVIDHPENKILLFQLLILQRHVSARPALNLHWVLCIVSNSLYQTFYSEYVLCSKDDYKLVIDVHRSVQQWYSSLKKNETLYRSVNTGPLQLESWGSGTLQWGKQMLSFCLCGFPSSLDKHFRVNWWL